MTHVLVISRVAPVEADVDDDPGLDEEHWSYMDRYADGMIARGPLLAADRLTWTGSMHIVELPSGETAREFVGPFVEREPYNRAGLFAEHVVRRFANVLDRTMWQWKSPVGGGDPLFVVTAFTRVEAASSGVALPALTPFLRERTIVLGELSTFEDATPTGVVWALQAPGREGIDTVLATWPTARDEQVILEVHDWEFGGRR